MEINYGGIDMTMIFCENAYCETPEEPIERVSDYRILTFDDGSNSVICCHCYELEEDAREEEAANALDS